MTAFRLTVEWTGFIGAPGYSTFIIDDNAQAAALVDGVKTFFDGLNDSLPDDVTINVPNQLDVFDETTGELTGVITASTPDTIVGLGTEGYSAPSGAVVNWPTDGFVAGRRVRGRTFLVPLRQSAYQTNGTLTDSFVSGVTALGNALLDDVAGSMVIWSRPRPATSTPGSIHQVQNAIVPDKAAVLRSRRD